MSVISLMTDFGIKDGTVGVMKGVIWGICPTAQISDMSHMIPAQLEYQPRDYFVIGLGVAIFLACCILNGGLGLAISLCRIFSRTLS